MNKMKNGLFLLLIIGLFGCGSAAEDTTVENSKIEKTEGVWYQAYEIDETDEDSFYEIGLPTGYVNEKGDTMVSYGKYRYIFTDTFTQMAIVMTNEGRCIGIDKNEEELFEVFWFDNGPDYVQDGLFRIKKGDKIGYANEAGEIIVEPKYKCTTPFSNGQARVAYECDLVKDSEYTRIENAKWINIDTEGNEAAEMVD
jgi:hypothetical protein